MTTLTQMTDTAATPSYATPAPAPAPQRGQTVVLRECAICQSSIYPDEPTHPCPSCALVFHAECWQENFGCASYGCAQVNALAPKIDIPAAAAAAAPADGTTAADDAPPAREPLPWDFVLLGASALALAASALSYGLPSLLAAAGVGWRMHRKRAYRNPILVAAAAVCVVGLIGGVVVSRFWFSQVDFTAGE